MNPENEKSAGQDVSIEVLEMPESQLWDFLDSTKGQALSIKLPVSALTTQFMENRLRRFLTESRGTVTLVGTEQEEQDNKNRLPGAKWERE